VQRRLRMAAVPALPELGTSPDVDAIDAPRREP
jgi:hypothetical protein